MATVRGGRLSRKQKERQSSQSTTSNTTQATTTSTVSAAPAQDMNQQEMQVANMLRAAHQANADIQALAVLAQVDYGTLLLCIVRQVKVLPLIRCIRQGGSLFECLGDNVDFEQILACAGGSVVGQNGDGF
jgi:hypothetical protein